jgi:hypothetical protein
MHPVQGSWPAGASNHHAGLPPECRTLVNSLAKLQYPGHMGFLRWARGYEAAVEVATFLAAGEELRDTDPTLFRCAAIRIDISPEGRAQSQSGISHRTDRGLHRFAAEGA